MTRNKVDIDFLFIFATMKRIFVSWLMGMVALMAVAQTSFRQRQLTMDGGLPSNTVNSIVQDSRGFMWLGTRNGLCRYDGVGVTAFRNANSLTAPAVSSLLLLGRDSLLVGTLDGLFLFDIVHEQFTALVEEAKIHVSDMIMDDRQRLWMATDGQGIACYHLDDKSLKTYEFIEVGGKVSRLCLDRDNRLWALAANAQLPLWQLDRSTDRFVPIDFVGQPTAMAVTDDGQLWVGLAEQGLACYLSDGSLETVCQAGSGHAQQINAMLEKSASELLLGCDDGLWLYNRGSRTMTLYLPQRFVNSMVLDREGGLWVGTDFGGASYLSPIANRFDSYPVGGTARLCEDRLGRLWTARENGGLDLHPKGHPEQTLSYAGQRLLDPIRAHSLCIDGDDLWIGTFSDGVYVYSTTTGRLRHYRSGTSPHSLYDPNSCTVMRDRKGTIWVATMEGLCCYQRASDDFRRVTRMVSLPIDIKEDHQGMLWIATQGDGIWRFNPRKGTTESYHWSAADTLSLPHDIVNHIFIDGKNHLWVGTQGGLCRYDEALNCFHRVALNVPQQAIASITESQGVLWMAGDCGVLRLDADGSLQRFTRQDGLDSEQFQAGAVLNGSDGRVYFGSNGGFNAFFPHQIRVNQQSAPVFITQLEVANRIVEVGTWRLPKIISEMEKLDIYTSENMFSLTFASLSYCSPEKNMYAYMLEGFDKQWNYVGHEHKATYTNLEPGTYTFLVRATNNDGIWSDRVARLVIEVHPPFWLNVYAKIFYVVFAMLLVALFIRLYLLAGERRHRREIARLNEIQQEEMRQARTDFFTTIAHEIRTPVSLIVGPLDTLKERLKTLNIPKSDAETLEVVDRNAYRLLDLVNQLLDFRKVEQSYQEMNFVATNIGELMRTVVKNFETIFRLNGRQIYVDYPPESFTAVVDREALTKLLSNMLSNAYKYAKTVIRLVCYPMADNQTFRIEVSDDGTGISEEDQKRLFDPFFQAKDRKPGTGIGLSIVKKIVELHNGAITVQSELGHGSRFIVELPVVQEYSGEQTADSQPAANTDPTVQEVRKPGMLIVEDNEDMLTFLVTTFMDDYEVSSASDGTEAVKILHDSLVVRDGQAPQSTIDVVISDWMMREMDGPELCNRMRQNAATKSIPFILLTAKTDSQSKIEAMNAGVDAYVEKPFNVKYLEACIRNLLSRR